MYLFILSSNSNRPTGYSGGSEKLSQYSNSRSVSFFPLYFSRTISVHSFNTFLTNDEISSADFFGEEPQSNRSRGGGGGGYNSSASGFDFDYGVSILGEGLSKLGVAAKTVAYSSASAASVCPFMPFKISPYYSKVINCWYY